jgi:protein required for attachment to host cells
MKKTWVLVANASQARCYSREKANAAWMPLAEFEDPLGRAKAAALEGDRAGHETTARSRQGTAYEPRVDARTKEHELFARRVAQFLNESVASRRCESLVIFASNPFLGKVKNFLDEHSSKALGRSVAMDLTSFTGPELSKRIDRHLLAPG